jgi:hypothetical protein
MGLFLKAGATIEAGFIVAMLPKVHEEHHTRCITALQWAAKRKGIVGCAHCKVFNVNSVISAVNCSTSAQNIFGRENRNFLLWKTSVPLKGPQEIFNNYGFHEGHIGCRQIVNNM